MIDVSDRIHDDEVDTTEATVRSLLDAQCSQFSGSTLTCLRTSGTDNAMWRVHLPHSDDVVVRLPRHLPAAQRIERELDLLPRLAGTSLTKVVRTPTVRHVGRPQDEFPYGWAVLGWLDGVDAWTTRATLAGPLDDLALDMARAVGEIGRLVNMPVARRGPGDRGGPIGPLLERLEWWLTDPRWNASSLIDVASVRRSAAEAREVAAAVVSERFVHGDLIPGNLLTSDRRLRAIIDWGMAAWADPAQDLAPAWSVFDQASRHLFREAVDVDDATWLRARTFELEHAVGGALYYLPRRHPLGDQQARTLQRILEEPGTRTRGVR